MISDESQTKLTITSSTSVEHLSASSGDLAYFNTAVFSHEACYNPAAVPHCKMCK